jgi:hypothetical protein
MAVLVVLKGMECGRFDGHMMIVLKICNLTQVAEKLISINNYKSHLKDHT